MTRQWAIVLCLAAPTFAGCGGSTGTSYDFIMAPGDEEDPATGDDDDDDDDDDDTDIETPPGDDDDDDDDDTVVVPTGSTGLVGPSGPFFEAEAIYVASYFGYDPLGQQMADTLFGTTSVSPAIEVYLATDAWGQDLSDVANYCAIVIPMDGVGLASWASADPAVWWGADYDASNTAFTSCTAAFGYELDPSIWGYDPLAEWVTGLAGASAPHWGVGVGDPSPTVDLNVVQALGADGALVVGGHMKVPDFLGTDNPDLYGFAYEVDVNMVTIDADYDGYLDPLYADDVETVNGIARAYYRMSSLIYWTL